MFLDDSFSAYLVRSNISFKSLLLQVYILSFSDFLKHALIASKHRKKGNLSL